MRGFAVVSLLSLASGQALVSTPVDESAPIVADAFVRALGESFMVILATEVGDRTFFIAAIMAMRHPRMLVWFGAVGALVVMTVLSTLVGHVAPMLISR